LIKNIRQKDGVTVIEMASRFDATTAPQVKAQLRDLVAAGQCRIVVNLKALEFIDSSGLGVLVGTLRRCVAVGGEMCLAEVPEFARSVLELTRLTRVFSIAATEDEAIRLVKESGAQ
jgi:anti-sigma B factor antagonist